MSMKLSDVVYWHLAELGLIVCICRLKEVTPDKIPQVRKGRKGLRVQQGLRVHHYQPKSHLA